MIEKFSLPNINKTFCTKILLVLFFMFSFVNCGWCQNTVDFLTNDEKNNISVYEKITPAIVSIEAQTYQGVSSGTGCVIDPSGLILTSMHVINNAQDIEVTTASGKIYAAKVWSVLKNNSDLAILRITPQEMLPVVSLGDSEQIRVGQKVLTIGNPFGFRGTFTTGIVSRIDYERNKIQTDAAINPGCSGGPLINTHGEVIGINQSIYNPDNNRSNIGIGFAVPINNAKDFINITLKRTVAVR